MDFVKQASREYKIVLTPAGFSGSENAIMIAIDNFLQCLRQIKVDGLFFKDFAPYVKHNRILYFYDTAGKDLFALGYIFRERNNVNDGKREVTLKFRHPDRFMSRERNMDDKDGSAEIKLEEDIKTPFVSFYSYSSTVTITARHNINKLNDITKRFPGMITELRGHRKTQSLVPVNDNRIHEMVIPCGNVYLGQKKQVAECAFIVWHLESDLQTGPMMVEFSFRYRNDKFRFNRGVSQAAYNLYMTIQEELKDWLSKESLTKTAFVYSKMS